MRRLTLPPLILVAALLCNCGDPVSPSNQAPAGFYYEPRTDVPMDEQLVDSLTGAWCNDVIGGTTWLEFGEDGSLSRTVIDPGMPGHPMEFSHGTFTVDGPLVTIYDSMGAPIATLGACFEP